MKTNHVVVHDRQPAVIGQYLPLDGKEFLVVSFHPSHLETVEKNGIKHAAATFSFFFFFFFFFC